MGLEERLGPDPHRFLAPLRDRGSLPEREPLDEGRVLLEEGPRADPEDLPERAEQGRPRRAPPPLDRESPAFVSETPAVARSADTVSSWVSPAATRARRIRHRDGPGTHWRAAPGPHRREKRAEPQCAGFQPASRELASPDVREPHPSLPPRRLAAGRDPARDRRWPPAGRSRRGSPRDGWTKRASGNPRDARTLRCSQCRWICAA